MKLDENEVFAIVEAYHACWSRADVAGMLSLCHEDVELRLNNANVDGGTLELFGKAAIAEFLLRIPEFASSTTVPEMLSYQHGLVRTTVRAELTHLRTGHTLSARYRQIIQFDGPKMLSLDDFHDVAMMRAFWDMVRAEEEAEAAAATTAPV